MPRNQRQQRGGKHAGQQHDGDSRLDQHPHVLDVVQGQFLGHEQERLLAVGRRERNYARRPLFTDRKRLEGLGALQPSDHGRDDDKNYQEDDGVFGQAHRPRQGHEGHHHDHRIEIW